MAKGRTNKQGGASVSLTGDAVVAEVLNSKTFYNTDPKTKLTGTMPNKVGSATIITPSTSDQIIPQGYYGGVAGDGKVSGDANLISANIKSGTNIFGVAGNSNVVDTSSGDAVAGEILSTKKAWVDGAEITGSMANNGVLGTYTPTTTNQSIPAGYTSGGTVAGDADLVAGNIKNGVNIFGVAGNYAPDGSWTNPNNRTGFTDTVKSLTYTGSGIAYCTISGLLCPCFFNTNLVTDSDGFVTNIDGVSITSNASLLFGYSSSQSIYRYNAGNLSGVLQNVNYSGSGIAYFISSSKLYPCFFNTNLVTDSAGYITNIDGVTVTAYVGLYGYSINI